MNAFPGAAFPQPAPPPVERQIVGILTSVEQRQAGFYRFSIQEPGKQYPIKCDTKQPDLVAAATALQGQQVGALVKEQTSTTINPNSGRPYVNRYLNAIAPAGAVPAVGVSYAMPPTPAPAPPAPAAPQQWPPASAQTPVATIAQPPGDQTGAEQIGLSGFRKDVNIMRQTAAKVVAERNPDLPLNEAVQECEAWVAYFVYGPRIFGVPAFTQAHRPPQLPQDAPDYERAYWESHGVQDGPEGPSEAESIPF